MASTLVKAGKQFGYWIEDMQKDSNDPDALTIVMMSHFLGKNITLLSGKADRVEHGNEHGCGHSAAVQRGQCLLSHGCRYIHFI